MSADHYYSTDSHRTSVTEHAFRHNNHANAVIVFAFGLMLGLQATLAFLEVGNAFRITLGGGLAAIVAGFLTPPKNSLASSAELVITLAISILVGVLVAFSVPTDGEMISYPYIFLAIVILDFSLIRGYLMTELGTADNRTLDIKLDRLTWLLVPAIVAAASLHAFHVMVALVLLAILVSVYFVCGAMGRSARNESLK